MVRPVDTSLEAWQVHVDALRRMSGEERVAKALDLSDTARRISEAGLRHRHPDWSDERIRDALLDLLLGKELAGAVRRSRLVTA